MPVTAVVSADLEQVGLVRDCHGSRVRRVRLVRKTRLGNHNGSEVLNKKLSNDSKKICPRIVRIDEVLLYD